MELTERYCVIMPALRRRGYREAVLPLLLIHAFRYGPLTLLMPEQVDPALPLGVREVIAYGIWRPHFSIWSERTRT